MAGGWTLRAARVVLGALVASLLLAAPALAEDDPISCGVFAQRVNGARTVADLDAIVRSAPVADCPETTRRAQARRASLAPPPPPVAPPVAPPSPRVSPPAPPVQPSAEEAAAWGIARETDSIGGYNAYLRRYPSGRNAATARQRIAALTPRPSPPVAPPPPPSFTDARTAPVGTRAPLVRNPSSLPDFALFRECDGCPEMVVIPGGSFLMGSPAGEEGRDEDEDSQAGAGGSQVSVRVPRFAIARFETTWDEWGACVSAGVCQQAPVDASGGDNGWGRGRRPVMNVGWSDAGAFAAWVNGRSAGGYRRPSEAEWEYAARAGTSTRFSWGNEDPTCDPAARNGANFGACTDDRTRTVGSFRANPWGLYDLHGNVWEWVEDCYQDNLSGQSAAANTTGDCSRRVLRGVSWYGNPQGLRSANRDGDASTNRGYYFGFRLARVL